MEKLLLFMLVFVLAVAPVCAGEEKQADSPEECVRPLDLGEPTPEEISQMEREEEHTRMEESGFSEGFDDTMEEMAGDNSKAEWEFNED